MTDKNPDLFGKIDAILEKRDALVLTDNVRINDDFPVLNEVIVDVVRDASEPMALFDPVNTVLRERRLGERRSPVEESVVARSENNNDDPRFSEMYEKLNRALQRNMERLEEDLRRVIREELAKIRLE